MLRKKREQCDIGSLLKNKHLPIVILDAHWHTLFESGKPVRIMELEKKLSDLMKQQGKMVTDVKDLKSAKHQLMSGIVANMDTSNASIAQINSKKLDKSQKLIRDINQKLDEADNHLSEIPYKIKAANEELVVAGMNDCYERLAQNTKRVEDLNQEIELMQEKLMQMKSESQQLEQENERMYSYMHNILGNEVIEKMDEFYAKRK